MTTKEQERKALEQIRKIVKGLGENSYVGTAFAGCFEDAEDNIENDFAMSMKDRYESSEKKIASLEQDNRDLRLAIMTEKEDASRKQTALEEENRKLASLVLSPDDLCDFRQMVDNEITVTEKIMKRSAETIVRMAEKPTDIIFTNAVRINRAMKSKKEYLEGIKTRIEKAEAAINGTK